jgi:hypothetical protein
MANHYWIKLYSDILHNPRMVRLDNTTWRHAVELFVLAGELGLKGRLGVGEDIAFHLRVPEEEVREALNKLEELGVVHQEEGEWLVCNFAERQAPSTSTQRVREHRRRKMQAGLFKEMDFEEDKTSLKEEGIDLECNENVTEGNGNETKQPAAVKRFPSASAYASASVSESASESASACDAISETNGTDESEVRKESLQTTSGAGPHDDPDIEELDWLTPAARIELEKNLGELPLEWLADAIREAKRYNATSPGYVKAILYRWGMEGRQPTRGSKVLKKPIMMQNPRSRYLEPAYADFIEH